MPLIQKYMSQKPKICKGISVWNDNIHEKNSTFSIHKLIIFARDLFLKEIALFLTFHPKIYAMESEEFVKAFNIE
jgi:hypothetical protein